ncbi:MAG: NUDIX hydrolase [Rhodospirillaceae bacterium]|nr:NUDIX hydrolase [Rhodospirillaceae bacterium]
MSAPISSDAVRHAIAAALEALAAFDDAEARDIGETLAWIRSGAEIFRLAKPDTPPKHLIAYFMVIDGDHLLLVDHKNSGLWLPPGGHVDPGEHPRDTVVREAGEELGIEAAFLRSGPVMLTVVETVGRTAGHTDVCLWYALRGDRHSVLDYCRDEFHGIRWFHKDALPKTRVEPCLGRFVAKYFRETAV